jgi:hypothetical protein
MQCNSCKTTNEPDSVFCSECGKPLADQTPGPEKKQRKSYLFVLLFVPVIVIAAAVGYYKFFLPDGVAAVVNGEEIRLSELNAAASRMQGGSDAASAGLRYQALNELIAERLALQEARKAGIEVSKDELAVAAAQAQAASGLDSGAFNKEMKSLHGSMRGFENTLERRILISRLIAERVVPPGADPGTAGRAADQWMRHLSEKAAVRIALAEQWSGGGCSCCNKEGGPAQPVSDKAKAATDACLQYWRAKHGPEAVSARLTDFGCHMQVDIVKNEKIIGSLRYQGGTITEL